MYTPCLTCAADQPLDKLTPIRTIGVPTGPDTYRCVSCDRRHIDVVMAQALEILIDLGFKAENAALKDAGTPLIVYGTDLAEPPRLDRKELILLLDHADRAAANLILSQVPEIKGVVKRHGNPRTSVGLPDTGHTPHLYELLAGCDIRADVVNSLLGDMCFYRRQSVMHIEFHRNNSVKIRMLEKMFLDGDIAGKTLVDGMASAGTLGILAAAGGAKKVVLNDAWLPAVESILLNIEANQEPLGVRLEHLQSIAQLPHIANNPTLIAKAHGEVELEVWHGDIRKLASKIEPCDICIIDAFPGIPPTDIIKSWQGTAKTKIITL